MHYYLVDIGNSNIKIFKEINNSYTIFEFKNFKDNRLIAELDKVNFEKNSFIILSSVSEVSKNILLKYFKNKKMRTYDFNKFNFISHINFDNVLMEEMGADRLINLLGNTYGTAVIVDLGTALTIDVVNNNIYETGFIFPGIKLQLNELINNTDLECKFKFKKFLNDYSFLTTQDQLNSSIILGIIGSINQYLKFIDKKVKLKDYEIIFTGGGIDFLNNLLQEKFKELIEYDFQIINNLNYLGLNKILEQFKKKEAMHES